MPCFRTITLAILGLDNAGKTVTAKGLKGGKYFIHLLNAICCKGYTILLVSTFSESLDDVTSTIGFTVVEFPFEKANIKLFDLGGGKNFRDVWKSYFSEVYGVIYVIDSSNHDRLDECAQVLSGLIEHPKVSGKPILV